MATFNLAITYPDGEQARILTAIKAAAATTADLPAPTKAQAWNWFEACCKASLRDVVRRYKREAAVKAAEASVLDVDVT